MNYTTDETHLSQDIVLRLVDDELSMSERIHAEAHLGDCDVCRNAVNSVQEFSLQVESAVRSVPVAHMDSLRQSVEKEILERTSSLPATQNPGKVMRRFGWGMGIAATLAFGILISERTEGPSPVYQPAESAQVSPAAQTSVIEVDGETFQAVPYANADLTTSAPHIVQMQVPVSSLADVGIVLEPVSNRVSSSVDAERSVLADVLIGADGQPRGVHVIGLEQ